MNTKPSRESPVHSSQFTVPRAESRVDRQQIRGLQAQHFRTQPASLAEQHQQHPTSLLCLPAASRQVKVGQVDLLSIVKSPKPFSGLKPSVPSHLASLPTTTVAPIVHRVESNGPGALHWPAAFLCRPLFFVIRRVIAIANRPCVSFLEELSSNSLVSPHRHHHQQIGRQESAAHHRRVLPSSLLLRDDLESSP